MQLELGVSALVLLAALMHAGWNTVVKTGDDPLLTMVLVTGCSSLIALSAIPFLTPPLYGSWGFICLSMLLHTGYKVMLLQAYRRGDLSQVYPLARGTAPLLIAVLSSWLAGEVLDAGQTAGVGIICLGVISLAFGGGLPRGKELPALGFALGTGMFIASYTTVDGLGVRAAGSAAGYIAWLLFLVEMPFNLGALLMRRGRVLAYLQSQWRPGLAGGTMTLFAYGLVVWALGRGAMAPVAALRETGVIFAALIGTIALGEPFGKHRVLAAAIIAGGIALLGLSSMAARI